MGSRGGRSARRRRDRRAIRAGRHARELSRRLRRGGEGARRRRRRSPTRRPRRRTRCFATSPAATDDPRAAMSSAGYAAYRAFYDVLPHDLRGVRAAARCSPSSDDPAGRSFARSRADGGRGARRVDARGERRARWSIRRCRSTPRAPSTLARRSHAARLRQLARAARSIGAGGPRRGRHAGAQLSFVGLPGRTHACSRSRTRTSASRAASSLRRARRRLTTRGVYPFAPAWSLVSRRFASATAGCRSASAFFQSSTNFRDARSLSRDHPSRRTTRRAACASPRARIGRRRTDHHTGSRCTPRTRRSPNPAGSPDRTRDRD